MCAPSVIDTVWRTISRRQTAWCGGRGHTRRGLRRPSCGSPGRSATGATAAGIRSDLRPDPRPDDVDAGLPRPHPSGDDPDLESRGERRLQQRPAARRAHRHPSRRADALRRGGSRPISFRRRNSSHRWRSSRSPHGASEDPDTAVTIDDILAWEQEHGRLPAGAFVAMLSGWGDRIGDVDAFTNADEAGATHYPGYSGEAAAFLCEERDIVGVGVDTFSLDTGTG